MRSVLHANGNNKPILLLFGLISTGIIYQYRLGISGNDFWWHVKAGEWIVMNKAVPGIDVFSWYAKENGIEWISHEWLSDVVFYLIHSRFGEIGIYALSIFGALAMAALMILKNQEMISRNFALSAIYLFPFIFLSQMYFYGRPQLFSYFLLYYTLLCLYKYRSDQKSKAIFFVPFIAILWSNFHGGSATLPYILCFIFFISGLFEFSVGKIIFNKLSKQQCLTYFFIGVLSFLFLAVNPHGIEMYLYPYTNMSDSFMQSIISEWSTPDAKLFQDLITAYLPILICGLVLILTDKRIRFIDLLIFIFFAYLSFRSIRFSIIFYIASSFFITNYFPPRELKSEKTMLDKAFLLILIVALTGVNIYSISGLIRTSQSNTLISIALDEKYIEFVKKESPRRLYNDYNFGETLIYNDIETFIDARADVFSSFNLHDAISLLYLSETDESKGNKIFDPEIVINKYNFDAFLIQTNRSLATYLKSHPEKYQLLMEDKNAAYFRTIPNVE